MPNKLFSLFSDNSVAGIINDHIDDEIIIPAVKPKNILQHFIFKLFLTKKMHDEPNIVENIANIVFINVRVQGENISISILNTPMITQKNEKVNFVLYY